MAGRDTKQLEENALIDPSSESESIMLHYPKPVPVHQILLDVANWAECSFVMEPKLARTVQIISPRQLTQSDAFSLFETSLHAVGLRIIRIQGNVFRVISKSLGNLAV